jgi:hypothetical protein
MKSNTIYVCAALAILAGVAGADIASISGDASTSISNTGVSFGAMLDYSYNGGTSGTLTVDISNSTSQEQVGGFLTGFVFNILSSDELATASLISSSNTSFLDTGIENAAPFGVFDAGAALDANWQGGGNPTFGLGIGESGSFFFAITASDASLLDAMSFVGSGSEFAVRFRGLSSGDSDKLLAPAPGTSAIALLGLGVMARRRR